MRCAGRPMGLHYSTLATKAIPCLVSFFHELGGPLRLLPRSNTGESAAFSPDGSQLAMWSGDVGGPIGITTAGDWRTPVDPCPGRIGFLSGGDWSPDGRFLALLSAAESGILFTLWTADLTTGSWHELASDTLPLSPPRWSRTGDAIYFYTYQSELRKLSVQATGFRRCARSSKQG